MAKNPTSLRFESREIAVILSLFIFVSLLMFTVGIVVGKGLAQAKYQGSVELASVGEPESGHSSPTHENSHEPNPKTPTGTSVSSNPPIPHTAPVQPPVEMAAKTAPEEITEQELGQPLELKPKKINSLNVHDEMKTDSELAEAETVLSNPKLSHLFESDKNPKEHKIARIEPTPQAPKEKRGDVEIERDYSSFSEPRKVASVSKEIPPSYSSGPFSVQVAAYSEEMQAKERVEALKKLGFPHAYLSSINLGEGKETWYRVWLGYYPSMATAKAGGDALQALGEVKNYLVRKSENPRKKD